jgi:hypothetical protein
MNMVLNAKESQAMTKKLKNVAFVAVGFHL